MRLTDATGARGRLARHRLLTGVIGSAVILGSALASVTVGTTSASAKVKPSSVHLAFLYAGAAEDFAEEMYLGAEAAAKNTGISLTSLAPDTPVDATAQVSEFTSAESTSKDGIALETLVPGSFAQPLTQAGEAHIPLVEVDTYIPNKYVKFYVGNSNTTLGIALANALLPKIPANATGSIVIGTDTPGLPPLVARNNGFTKRIHQERPKITFVNFDSTQAPATNLAAWQAAVTANPDALAYVGPGSQDATSMADIERTTHTHYLVGADDLDPVALQGIKSGLVQVLISPEHWLKGYIAVHILAEHALTGAKIPSGWWNPGYLVVNKKNINEILARQKSPATRAAWFKKEVNYELAHPSKYIKPLADIN